MTALNHEEIQQLEKQLSDARDRAARIALTQLGAVQPPGPSAQPVLGRGLAAQPGVFRAMPRNTMVRAMQNRVGRSALPSQIQTQPIAQVVVRYTVLASAGDTNLSVTVQQLLGWQLAVATTTTSTSAISTSAAFRIRRVSVWSNAATNLTNQISLTWTGSAGFGLSRSINAVGTTALPAHINAVPPEDTEAAFWHNTQSTQTAGLFNLTGCDVGDVLDIHLEYISTGVSDFTTPANPAASTTQRWVLPGAVASGVYRQALQTTLGGTVVWTPSDVAFLAPTSQAIV